jgi:hypothetical protein
MSVRTYVTMNEKIEYKIVDEQGKSKQLSPSISKMNGGSSQNELVLMKKNSIL